MFYPDLGFNLALLFNLSRCSNFKHIPTLPLELWFLISEYLDLFSFGKLIVCSHYFNTVLLNYLTTNSIFCILKNTHQHIPFERLSLFLMRRLATLPISDAINYQVNLCLIKKSSPTFRDQLFKLYDPLSYRIKFAPRESIDLLFVQAILTEDYSIIDYCLKFFKSTLYDWYISDTTIKQILKKGRYLSELNLFQKFLNRYRTFHPGPHLQLNIPFLLPIILEKFHILSHINDLNYQIVSTKFLNQNRILTPAKYTKLIVNARIGVLEYYTPPTNNVDILCYFLALEIYDHYNYLFFNPTKLFKKSRISYKTKNFLIHDPTGYYLGRFNTYSSYQYMSTKS